jgi:uncharacterized protein YbaR (Trm112 family)
VFIELVDSLRCVEPHDETWLVAAVDRMDGRHIVTGTLGCPICRREYPIRDGVGWFTSTPGDAAASSLTLLRTTADEERLTRAAALLGIMDPGGVVVLGGHWIDAADGIAALGAAHVVVLNAVPSDTGPQEISALAVDDRLPFGSGSLRAVALAGDTASGALLDSAADRVRSHGRLVAPAGVAVPLGIVELARDASDWVGERSVVASPPVMLRSARR